MRRLADLLRRSTGFSCKGYCLLDVVRTGGLDDISRISRGGARVFIVWYTGDIVVVGGHGVGCVERSVGPLCCKQRARLVVVLRSVCVAHGSRRCGGDQSAGDCVVQLVPGSHGKPVRRAEDRLAMGVVAVRLSSHAQGQSECSDEMQHGWSQAWKGDGRCRCAQFDGLLDLLYQRGDQSWPTLEVQRMCYVPSVLHPKDRHRREGAVVQVAAPMING
jgi:hypothetical protein